MDFFHLAVHEIFLGNRRSWNFIDPCPLLKRGPERKGTLKIVDFLREFSEKNFFSRKSKTTSRSKKRGLQHCTSSGWANTRTQQLNPLRRLDLRSTGDQGLQANPVGSGPRTSFRSNWVEETDCARGARCQNHSVAMFSRSTCSQHNERWNALTQCPSGVDLEAFIHHSTKSSSAIGNTTTDRPKTRPYTRSTLRRGIWWEGVALSPPNGHVGGSVGLWKLPSR
jgi:hypothetical protein